MNTRKILLVGLFLLFVSATAVFANTPQIGYLYPAGGQKGTVVDIIAGGQFLRGPVKVYVTGEGVTAEVVDFCMQIRNINGDQRKTFTKRLTEVTEKRVSELPSNIRKPIMERVDIQKQRLAKNANKKKKLEAAKKADAAKKKKVSEAKKTEAEKAAAKAAEKKAAKRAQIPKHPLLIDLDNKSLRELEHIKKFVFMPRNKLQVNRQLAELVMIKVTIDPDAKPGNRELRIQTKTGLSDPIVFQVGSFPEQYELEPNDRRAFTPIKGMEELPTPKAIKLPAVLNGQIMPGDVDRFRFRAEEGQKLVIEAHARSLIPYLADAVPGWFQATVALYRSNGREVAFADDYQFNPDPVMFYEIDMAGEYELEIRDSIYRGREDFVYRIVVGDQPFITEMFPLGGEAGSNAIAEIDGWNITKKILKLDTSGGGNSIRHAEVVENGCVSNTMSYVVDEFSECVEADSNDSISDSQRINLPVVVNGRIEKAGDTDVFSFRGKSGDEIVAEVFARRLNSPLDSLVQLTDSRGKAIKWNDDYVVKESHLYKDVTGLVTHHADSYLVAKLPDDGTYYVHLSDSQRHGGRSYSYRLRVCKRVGDFALRVTPSSVFMYGGSAMPLRVHVLRTDGFDGAVELSLKDVPEGFKISGGRIPAGSNMVDVTLTAPADMAASTVALTFEGNAQIGGRTVTRQAMPADDLMQAFLYRHLVPAKEFLVAVEKRKWGFPDVRIVGDDTVRLEPGGSAEVVMRTYGKKSWVPKNVKLALHQGPEGISISDVKSEGRQITFVVKAEKEAMSKGYKGNLILEAVREYVPKDKNGKPLKGRAKTKSAIGILPAIPVVVAAR